MIKDTAMSQYVPPTLFHCVVGTWTWTAGAVAGTIAKHRATAADTTVITIPITVPSNSVALKGAYLKSIEIDYDQITHHSDSVTPLVNKVTRSANGSPPVVAAQAFTQSPDAAGSITADQHKLVLTITTPFWLLNTEYVLVELTMVHPADAATTNLLAAVANFNLAL